MTIRAVVLVACGLALAGLVGCSSTGKGSSAAGGPTTAAVAAGAASSVPTTATTVVPTTVAVTAGAPPTTGAPGGAAAGGPGAGCPSGGEVGGALGGSFRLSHQAAAADGGVFCTYIEGGGPYSFMIIVGPNGGGTLQQFVSQFTSHGLTPTTVTGVGSQALAVALPGGSYVLDAEQGSTFVQMQGHAALPAMERLARLILG